MVTLPLRSLAAASLLAASSVILPATPASAQLALPQASPAAKVEQQVGVSQVAVSYSSPGVKGRQIWGGLVPYGEVWRTGANQATTLTVSHDFTFGGKSVPAGTYAIFTIPGESSWTVGLNTNSNAWGTFAYDAKNDVARVEVQPQTLADSRERLTFLFADADENQANLVLEWEKLRISVPVAVDTPSLVTASLQRAVAEAWKPTFETANWLLTHDGDLKEALANANASIAIQSNWRNHWVKAQIQAKAGKRSDAIKTAKLAQKLGKDDRIYGFYADQIATAISGWQK